MLVSENDVRRTKALAYTIACCIVVATVVLCTWSLWFLILLPAAFLLYRWMTISVVRQWTAVHEPFPSHWVAHLERDVEYYRALSKPNQIRFQKMMQGFLAEVQITGIGTEIDDQTRVLVAASAVIPVFGFEHWNYTRLGEVLIYPQGFDDKYKSVEGNQSRTLGLVGTGHLSGVMILSKPDLIAGFRNANDKRNVGIHEFAHLVDRADGAIDGIPPGIPAELAQQWIQWVGEELKREAQHDDHIDDYAFTNEAEYFAVLSEYFFESPATLQSKAPAIYDKLEKMYHQQPKQLLRNVTKRRRRVGRNSPCPCGSGEKFKRCCLKLRRH